MLKFKRFSISTRQLNKLNHIFDTKHKIYSFNIHVHMFLYLYTNYSQKIQYKLLEEYVHPERQWFCQE